MFKFLKKSGKKIYRYFNGDANYPDKKSHKHAEERQSLIYRRLGLILGTAVALTLSISLLVTGMAAIPLIGPGSFVPLWLGSIFFVALFVAPLSGMGWYNGKWLDTWKTKHFSNEPLFMSIMLTASLAFFIVLALAQPHITIPFVASTAGWNALSTAVFVINYTAAAGSFGNFIGRIVDTHTKNRNILTIIAAWFCGDSQDKYHKITDHSDTANTKELQTLSTASSTIAADTSSKSASHLNKKDGVVQAKPLPLITKANFQSPVDLTALRKSPPCLRRTKSYSDFQDLDSAKLRLN